MNIFKRCFVTALFAGYAPVAPGTFGTLVAAVAAGALSFLPPVLGSALVAVLFLILLYPAIRFSTEAEAYFGEKDPQKVVIDEVLGYFLTVMSHPLSLPLVAAAFVLFRFFDILKPYPINSMQSIKGGRGIVVDDLVAGVYANITLTILIAVSRHFGVTIL